MTKRMIRRRDKSGGKPISLRTQGERIRRTANSLDSSKSELVVLPNTPKAIVVLPQVGLALGLRLNFDLPVVYRYLGGIPVLNIANIVANIGI